MSVTVSLINMKGGVGKTTLAFNLAWYAAWKKNLQVLAVDLDPQSNLSHYFMGAKKYVEYLEAGKATVVEVFEQFSSPKAGSGSPTPFNPDDVIHRLRAWTDDSLLDLVPSRLELAWTLKNPTEKAHLLPQFLSKVSRNYDLILIDCPPTESILTTAVPFKPLCGGSGTSRVFGYNRFTYAGPISCRVQDDASRSKSRNGWNNIQWATAQQHLARKYQIND